MNYVQATITEFNVICQRCQQCCFAKEQPSVTCGSCDKALFHAQCIFSGYKPGQTQDRKTFTQCTDCEERKTEKYTNAFLKPMVQLRLLREQMRCVACQALIQLGDVHQHQGTCPIRYQECVCGENVKGVDAFNHHRKYACLLREETCVYCECVVAGSRDEFTEEAMKRHLKICGKRAVNCMYCNQSYAFDFLIQHQQNCNLKTQSCNACGKYVNVHALQNHIDNCEMRNVNCPNCHQNIPHRTLAQHTRDCQIPRPNASQIVPNPQPQNQ